MSRAPRRWQDASRRHAAEHAELAHPAHARLRRDDDHRVSVESRRAGGGRAIPGQSRAAILSLAPEAFCSDRSVSIDTSASPIWNGWSPSPNNSRFSPAALAKLTRRAGLEAEAEVGLRIRGRHLRLRAADSDWQSGLHWQRRRRGARAARGHRLPAVDVPGCGIDSFRDGGRAAGWPATCCSSAISLAGSTRSTRRPGRRSGASGPRSTKRFA